MPGETVGESDWGLEDHLISGLSLGGPGPDTLGLSPYRWGFKATVSKPQVLRSMGRWAGLRVKS